MAYTASKHNSMPGTLEPGVVGPIRCTRENANVDMPVYIPWKNCRLAYAYSICTTVPATNDFVLDLELNTAGGGAMMTITVAQSGAAYRVPSATAATLR